MLLVVFILLLPTLLHGITHITRALTGWRYGGEDSRAPFLAEAPVLPDECTQVADWSPVDEVPDFQLPDDVVDDGYRHHRRAFETSLTLPTASDLLYFVSEGSLSHGAIFITDDGEEGSKDVKVDVTFVYHHDHDHDDDHILEWAKVCLLQPEDGHNGVGIYTPHRVPRRHVHGTGFIINVHLPASASSPLEIKEFKTDMSLFFHSVSDLSESVYFKSLSLRTSNTPIYATAIAAQTASLRTSNSRIAGNFSVHETLELRSSNGPIVTNVTMFNTGATDATNLTMRTSNGFIHSNVSLVADTKDSTGGSYNVIAHSSNSPIDVTFPSAPVDSLLHVDGHTSNSPARLTLDSAYEGTFSLQTGSWFPTTVERRNEQEEDPAGKDRKRDLQFRSIRRGFTEGKVAWSPSDRKEVGTAVLTTSNSPVALYL